MYDASTGQVVKVQLTWSVPELWLIGGLLFQVKWGIFQVSTWLKQAWLYCLDPLVFLLPNLLIYLSFKSFAHLFSFLCCPFVCFYVLGFVLLCPLRFPHKTVRLYLQLFVGKLMSYLRCSVRLYLQLFVGGLMSYLCCSVRLYL